MWTDTLFPAMPLVAALNLVTKSPMLMPACPSAGPSGGAGVALAASIINFTFLTAFFAICNLDYIREISLYFLNLQEIKFHRRFASEHGDQNFDLAAVLIHGTYL